jgi:hypothetical protein
VVVRLASGLGAPRVGSNPHPPPRELFGTIEVTTCANAVVSTNQDANNWRTASPPAISNLAFTDAPGYRENLAIYAIAPPERRLFKYSSVQTTNEKSC